MYLKVQVSKWSQEFLKNFSLLLFLVCDISNLLIYDKNIMIFGLFFVTDDSHFCNYFDTKDFKLHRFYANNSICVTFL